VTERRGYVQNDDIIDDDDDINNWCIVSRCMDRDSSVGIAIRHRLDGPGIETRWAEIFRTRPDRPSGQPSLLYNGYLVFPRGKAGGVALNTHPIYRRG